MQLRPIVLSSEITKHDGNFNKNTPNLPEKLTPNRFSCLLVWETPLSACMAAYTAARHCTASWQAVTDITATLIGVATMVKFAVLSVSNIGE